MIRPVQPEPIRLSGPVHGPSFDAPTPSAEDGWRHAYWLKQQQFAAETRRSSILVRALHDLGHRSTCPHVNCHGCRALLAAGAIDPASSPPVPSIGGMPDQFEEARASVALDGDTFTVDPPDSGEESDRG